jgi:hypothetical protein
MIKYCKILQFANLTATQLDEQINVQYGEQDAQTTLRIAKRISDRIERRLLKSSEFKTVDAYAEFVLEQVLNQIESQDEEELKMKKQDEVFSKEDQEDVEQRLRDLGYL